MSANFSPTTCSTNANGTSEPLFCCNSSSAICALASFKRVSAVNFLATLLSAPPCRPINLPRQPITAFMSYQPRFSFGQPCRSQVFSVYCETCIMSASVADETSSLPSSVSSIRLLYFGLLSTDFTSGVFLLLFGVFTCVSFFISSQPIFESVSQNFHSRLDAGCPTIVTATPTRRTRARFCVHNLCFLNTSNYCVTLCFTGYTYIIACAGC